MNAPIFVGMDDEPLVIFRTASKVTVYAEAIDVENGVYGPVFDWDGYRLELDIVRERRRGWFRGGDQVVMRELDDPPDPDGLAELLDRALELMGEVDSLDELRRRALEKFGFT